VNKVVVWGVLSGNHRNLWYRYVLAIFDCWEFANGVRWVFNDIVTSWFQLIKNVATLLISLCRFHHVPVVVERK